MKLVSRLGLVLAALAAASRTDGMSSGAVAVPMRAPASLLAAGRSARLFGDCSSWPLLEQVSSGHAPAAGGVQASSCPVAASTWKTAGANRAGGETSPRYSPGQVYAQEFAGAAVGSVMAGLASLVMVRAATESNPWIGMAAAPTFAISSAFLSAAGAHLVGRTLGHGSTFGRALAGGGLGGCAGGVCLSIYLSTPGGRGALVPAALALPAAGAVAVYGVWR